MNSSEIFLINACSQAILTIPFRSTHGKIDRFSIAKFVSAIRLPNCLGVDQVNLVYQLLDGLRDAGLFRFHRDRSENYILINLELTEKGREEARNWK